MLNRSSSYKSNDPSGPHIDPIACYQFTLYIEGICYAASDSDPYVSPGAQDR
jgi:hypothetical protein